MPSKSKPGASSKRRATEEPLDGVLTVEQVEKHPKLSRALKRLRDDFKSIRQFYQLTPQETRAVLRVLLKDLAQNEVEAVEPPAKAPEVWPERDLNRRENPPQFIARVYAKWLGRGLLRRHLATLDPDLYKALSVWLTRHPDDDIASILPPHYEVMDEVIADLEAQYPPETLRRIGYAIEARARRNLNT